MFSLVIPIYNVENYIRKCIESVLNQTMADFELILVDDGSTDACRQICDNYAKRDSRITVIHKENGGLISAWKAGVNCATKEYLLFVDGDDWIEPNLLEVMAKIISTYQVDLIQFQFCKYQKEVESHIILKNSEELYPYLVYYKGYKKILANNRCGKVFKTEKYRNLMNDIDERVKIGEDKQIVFVYVLKSKKILFSNYQGYNYRQNFSSMTNSYDKEMYEKTEILFHHLKLLAQKYSNYDFSEQLKKEKVIFGINIISNAFRGDRRDRRRVFNEIIQDHEIRNGISILDKRDLNLYGRKIVDAIEGENFISAIFWYRIKRIKNCIDQIINKLLHRELR